ncbi:MAG: recombinase zinc beta ribbon domain-containing protein [Candidatus Coatesbacteria bacterium]|nr:recombinase zinc beta ribbon domain-containing protein [Candidatus Coatesbacteria bacterium]
MWKGIYYEGKHEPIISRELFNKVQEVLSGKGRPRKRVHDFTFKGLLRCGHCGCRLVGYLAKGKYIYYHCNRSKAICNEKYVSEQEMDKQFMEDLKYFKMSNETIEHLRNALNESHQEEKLYFESCMNNLDQEIKNLRKKLSIAYEDRVNGIITAEEYVQMSNAWKMRLSEVSEEIDRHDKANIGYYEDGERILELAQNAVLIYFKMNSEEKRKLLNLVYSNCFWKDGKMIPQYRQPFDILIDMNKKKNQMKGQKRLKIDKIDRSYPWRDLNLRPTD